VIAALEEYLAAMQEGRAPARTDFLARHTEIAAALGECLEGLEWIRGGPAGARSAAAPAVDPTGAGVQPGITLGDYQILREVGRGGMGVVFEAVQLSLGRRVALKVLPFAAALDGKQLQRFKNEAQAAAHLHHTNIVPVFGIGCELGVHYYAMQFIEGQTLAAVIGELRHLAGREPVPGGGQTAAPSGPASRLLLGHAAAAQAGGADPQRTGPFPPEVVQTHAGDTTLGPAKPGSSERSLKSPGFFRAVAQLGIQAAEALEHAHQLGVVHRDIKPSNLLVQGETGVSIPGVRLWVTDFGLAHMHSQAGLTMTGDLVGTLRYMSPEQALARRVPIDHRTDLYSLGATLYELLTLAPVFAGCDRQELLRQIAFDEPIRPRRLNRFIPIELETIVLKAIEKNPGDRYAAAQELADDLERFLKDEPIRARRPTLVQRARKWTRRHKAASRAFVCVFLVCLLAAGGFWYERPRQATAEALREAEALRQHDLTVASIGNALAQAESSCHELHKILRRKGGVFDLLNQPDKWQAHLQSARAALDQAKALLARGGDGIDRPLEHKALALERLLKADDGDRQLALDLEKIREEQAKIVDGQFNITGTDAAYQKTFAREGFDVLEGDPRVVAGRIARSLIKEQLVAALDDWSNARSRFPRQKPVDRLLQVARLAAPDPAWGDQLRQVATWNNRAALETLARKAAIGDLSPQMLHRMAILLRDRKSEERLGWLRRAQAQVPTDFSLNFELANALADSNPLEASGFFRAALAVRPKSWVIYNNLGNTLVDLKRFDEAAAACRKAIQLDPKIASAHNNLGNALAGQKRLDEAIAAYEEAIRLNPNSHQAYHNLGNALARLKRVDEASAAYQKAVDIHPDPVYATAYDNLGMDLADQGRLDEAIAKFEMAIKLAPKFALAYCHLSRVLRKLKRSDEAIAVCYQAIKMDGQSAPAYNSLGSALADQKRLDEAVQAYQKAVQLDAKFAGAYNNLGNVLRDLKRLDEAVVAHRRAIDIDPRDAYAYSNLGMTLDDQMRLDEAIAAYQKAIQIDPKFATARYNLGNAYWKLKRLDEAITTYQKAIELDPNYAKTYCSLGAALYARHRLDEAIAQFQKAIQKDPELAVAYANLGGALLDKKRVKEAVAVLEKAIEIDRKNAGAYSNLGDAHHAQQRLDEAIAAYREAIRLAPKLANPRLGLAKSLFKKGLFREAAEAAQQARDLLPPGDLLHHAAELILTRSKKMLALSARLSQVLDGSAKAEGPELIELAKMCRGNLQRYSAAAHLYRQAFQADPGGADWARRYRFDAARAAALASAGAGQEAAMLTAKDKAELRRQALDWLRDELKSLTQTVADYQAATQDGTQPPDSPLQKLTVAAQKPGPADLVRVCDRLQHWQTVSELASLRDEKELTKLPPDEQQLWRQLGSDVQKLVQLTRTCFTETKLLGTLTGQRKEQAHEVKLHTGTTYVIDLQSSQFDPYLRLQDAHGKVLAENDDISPDNLNSRLLVMVNQSATYRLVVTSFQQHGAGAYNLSIREFTRPAVATKPGRSP
jgi:tetratricopeptide (TPR) repeat protein